MRIDFSGLTTFLSEQFLNIAQVHAFFEQVGSKGMLQVSHSELNQLVESPFAGVYKYHKKLCKVPVWQ